MNLKSSADHCNINQSLEKMANIFHMAVNGDGQELGYQGLFFDVNTDATFISGLNASIDDGITDFAAKGGALIILSMSMIPGTPRVKL